MGTLQANVGLWQILARQGQISAADLNGSWQKLLSPFAKISSETQLFDAGKKSLTSLMMTATGTDRFSQDDLINLLAGPLYANVDANRVHKELASRMQSVLAGQRLVSIDTILALGDGLEEMARGA